MSPNVCASFLSIPAPTPEELFNITYLECRANEIRKLLAQSDCDGAREEWFLLYILFPAIYSYAVGGMIFIAGFLLQLVWTLKIRKVSLVPFHECLRGFNPVPRVLTYPEAFWRRCPINDIEATVNSPGVDSTATLDCEDTYNY